MPLFALVYRYVDDAELVSEHRPEHREYLRTLHERGDLLVAGPLGDPGPPRGLLILDVDSVEQAEEIADHDPFHARGAIADRSIQTWTLSFGAERLTDSPTGGA